MTGQPGQFQLCQMLPPATAQHHIEGQLCAVPRSFCETVPYFASSETQGLGHTYSVHPMMDQIPKVLVFPCSLWKLLLLFQP